MCVSYYLDFILSSYENFSIRALRTCEILFGHEHCDRKEFHKFLVNAISRHEREINKTIDFLSAV